MFVEEASSNITRAGNGFCVQYGTVVEENTIVNEVAFGVTQIHQRSCLSLRRLQTGNTKLHAYRFFGSATGIKCFHYLFLAPFQNPPFFFSFFKVNVFELGRTYLQLVQTLNL